MANAPDIAKQKARQANNVLIGVGGLALLALAILWLGPGRGLGSLAATLGRIDPVAYWLGLLVLMALLIGGIGRATNGHWLGALIDSSTNSMSLSRLQVGLWTILVLSAYLMLAMPRVFGALTAIDKMDKNDPLLAACLKDKPADFVPSMDACGGGALQITFPPQLVLAMGISLASFAGSHLIQNVKSSQDLDLAGQDKKVNAAKGILDTAQAAYEAQRAKSNKIGADYSTAQDAAAAADANVKTPPAGAALEQLKTEQSNAKRALDLAQIVYQRSINDLSQAKTSLNEAQQDWETAKDNALAARSNAAGVLHKNENIDQASWVDIFRGNLVTDYTQVDFGKVQMFFFTVVIVLAYGAAVAALLRSGPAMLNPLGIGFPAFSDSLNGLLAISHGAYLTTKATAQV